MRKQQTQKRPVPKRLSGLGEASWPPMAPRLLRHNGRRSARCQRLACRLVACGRLKLRERFGPSG